MCQYILTAINIAMPFDQVIVLLKSNKDVERNISSNLLMTFFYKMGRLWEMHMYK